MVRFNYLILFMLVFVIGCDSSHSLQHNLQEYQQRMANVLGLDSPNNLPVSLPPYPALNSLKQPIQPTTIKLFEFYQLKHCKLYSLVAERNTALGNLQLPSTRYMYERHLIEALEQCLIDTTDAKLREKLQNWQTIKTQQLPMAWADLLQLSSETKQALSSNSSLVTGNEKDGLNQTKAALHYLLGINQNTQGNSAELEQHLQSLLNNPLPAKLWLSQLTLTQHLNHLTEWLNQHTNQLPCNGSKKRIEYLTNVFQRYFIEKIQPVASQINHYQYQLSPIFEIMVKHPDLSQSFKNFIDYSNHQGFKNYQLAMQQHIQYWQGLFKRCNIRPGKS